MNSSTRSLLKRAKRELFNAATASGNTSTSTRCLTTCDVISSAALMNALYKEEQVRMADHRIPGGARDCQES